MPPKRRVGRPRLTVATRTVSFRVPLPDHRRLRAVSAAESLSVAATARRMVLRALPRQH